MYTCARCWVTLKICLPIVGSCGLLTAAAALVAELALDDRPRILPNAEPINDRC